MLDCLITSKTRMKLIMKFFINGETTAYLRTLSNEFGESSNSIRQELNRLHCANLIVSKMVQNRKVYQANIKHPFYEDIHHLVIVDVGIDQIIDLLIKRIDNLQMAYVTNGYSQGKIGSIIDLVLVGNNLNEPVINELVHSTEAMVGLKIRYITIQPNEVTKYIKEKECPLLIWNVQN